jgi:hypothetical protein
MIDATLKHTTTMFMCCDLDTIFRNSVENELIVLFSKLIETFLNDVIPIEIFREQHYIRLQCIFNELNLYQCDRDFGYLLRHREMFKEFLHCPCSMLIKRDLNQIRRNNPHQLCPLRIITYLKQLLT